MIFQIASFAFQQQAQTKVTEYAQKTVVEDATPQFIKDMREKLQQKVENKLVGELAEWARDDLGVSADVVDAGKYALAFGANADKGLSIGERALDAHERAGQMTSDPAEAERRRQQDEKLRGRIDKAHSDTMDDILGNIS